MKKRLIWIIVVVIITLFAEGIYLLGGFWYRDNCDIGIIRSDKKDLRPKFCSFADNIYPRESVWK